MVIDEYRIGVKWTVKHRGLVRGTPSFEGVADRQPWLVEKDWYRSVTPEVVKEDGLLPGSYESEQHWFAVYWPFFTYVGKSRGGAITFKGFGRWSSRSSLLSLDLGIPLMDCIIDGHGGYAVSLSEMEQMLAKHKLELLIGWKPMLLNGGACERSYHLIAPDSTEADSRFSTCEVIWEGLELAG